MAPFARAVLARRALGARWCGCVQVTPVVSIVQDFSEGIRLIKLLDHILEVRAPPQRRPLPRAEDLTAERRR